MTLYKLTYLTISKQKVNESIEIRFQKKPTFLIIFVIFGLNNNHNNEGFRISSRGIASLSLSVY